MADAESKPLIPEQQQQPEQQNLQEQEIEQELQELDQELQGKPAPPPKEVIGKDTIRSDGNPSFELTTKSQPISFICEKHMAAATKIAFEKKRRRKKRTKKHASLRSCVCACVFGS